MFKISLINMPFAALNLPSIGLTQIQSVVNEQFGERVSVEICYANQDFGRYLGVDPYGFIASGMESHNSGLGEWFFRQAAFPELPDNLDRYFKRYFPHHNEQTRMYRTFIEEKKAQFDIVLSQIIEKYRLTESKIVGFTSMFTQNLASFALARRIKNLNTEVLIIMGGANCESPMGQILIENLGFLDFTFSGPALISFPKFVEHLLNNEPEKCDAINGVFSKVNVKAMTAQSCGSTLTKLRVVSQTLEPIRQLGDELHIDELVDLDYSSFLDTMENNFPNGEVEPTLLFETSRGCWWGEKAHCTFCGLNGATMTYRAMSAENAIKVIKSVFKYSDRCSRLSSVDNILPKSYLKDVLPYLDTPPNISIFYEVKSDLTEENIQALAKARVKSIQPGVESLATSTLKLMKKGSSAFQNLEMLKNCVMYDVSPEWNLLVGFPGEEEDVYKKYLLDLPLLVHLPPPSGVYPVRFDRYSPYFVKAKEYGLELTPLDYYRFTYPFDEEKLADLAYYFMDRNTNAKYFLTMVRWVGKVREKFQPWHDSWHGGNGSNRPQLYCAHKNGSSMIHDTRSGKPIDHSINEVGTLMLELMEKPKRITELDRELAHISQTDLEKEMTALQEKGLLFREGERYFSLVLPREPPKRESSNRGGFTL